MKEAFLKFSRSFSLSSESFPDTSSSLQSTQSNQRQPSQTLLPSSDPRLAHALSGNNNNSSNILLNNGEDDDDNIALPPVDLRGYSSATRNRIMNTEIADEIRPLMPTRIQLYTEWTLLYSLEQHGASLRSLYSNIAAQQKQQARRRIGYVIIIKDRHGGVFGGYSNEPWLPHENRQYFGNGECFLWKLEKVPEIVLSPSSDSSNGRYNPDVELVDMGNSTRSNDGERTPSKHRVKHHATRRAGSERWSLKGYPYTGENEFAVYCTSKFLSMGAGDGHYGLWCDDGLVHGVSYPCLTYGNEPLSREGKKFHIIALEVWRIG